jgi:NAD(P)-dependent dehydrogenase (short-subunit alcohol dehydrogenase family)
VLLENKVAVVYGGAGAIGSAVARAFAREGATVHLAGRTRSTLDAVAEKIRAAGGRAETAEVDAYDEQAVDAHADAVVAASGSLDISMNVVPHGDVQGTPLVEMAVDDFLAPVLNGLRTTFLTARAAARHMVPRKSGVILVFGGYGDPARDYFLGGLQVGFQALDSLRRQFAVELGRHGVRALTLQTGGVPETIPEGFEGRAEIVAGIVGSTVLGRAATFDDVGNVAAFAASDWARTMTGTALNITAGAEID